MSEQTRAIAERARRIYDERLWAALEADHRDRYVAVEPDSGDYFLADTIDGAVAAARAAYPSRLPHVMRVGHAAAVRLEWIGLRQISRDAMAASLTTVQKIP